MKPSLVVFGEDWGRHPSSTQHLVGRLTGERKVVWVNSIGLRRPRLTAADLSRLAVKGAAMLRRKEKPGVPGNKGRPIIVDPKVLPFPGNRLASAANRRLLGRSLGKVMNREGIEKPILWISLPTAVDAIGALGERAVVYYCGDDFSSLSGVDHRAVSALEEELAHRADLILVASPVLAAKFPADKTRLLLHGADTGLFGTPVLRARDLPEGCPVAGFYGSISDWVDLDLIAGTARLLPGWEFILVGPVRTDTRPLEGLPNVRLLGEKAHGDLPGYSQHWQASMLPFRDNPQIHACNPLKLREYLAAGRPLVSTDFPALNGYRDLVRIVDSPRSMAACLEEARVEGMDRAGARRARVASESWEARAGKVSRLLDAL